MYIYIIYIYVASTTYHATYIIYIIYIYTYILYASYDYATACAWYNYIYI